MLDLEPPQGKEAELDAAGVRLRPDRAPHDLHGLVRRNPNRPDVLPHLLRRDAVNLRGGDEALAPPCGAGDEMTEREASPVEDRELTIHPLNVEVPPHPLRAARDLRRDPPQREVRELVATDLLPVPEDPALELCPRPFRCLVQREVQWEEPRDRRTPRRGSKPCAGSQYAACPSTISRWSTFRSTSRSRSRWTNASSSGIRGNRCFSLYRPGRTSKISRSRSEAVFSSSFEGRPPFVAPCPPLDRRRTPPW